MPRTPKMLSNANFNCALSIPMSFRSSKTHVVESIIAQEYPRESRTFRGRKNLMDLDFHSDTRCFITFVSKQCNRIWWPHVEVITSYGCSRQKMDGVHMLSGNQQRGLCLIPLAKRTHLTSSGQWSSQAAELRVWYPKQWLHQWLPSSPNLWFANKCNKQSIRLSWIVVKSESIKSSISSICCNHLMAHTKPYLHKQHWQQRMKMRNIICSKLITQHPYQCSDIPFLGSFVGQKTHHVQIWIYQHHGGACIDGGPLWSLWGCHNLPPSV